MKQKAFLGIVCVVVIIVLGGTGGIFLIIKKSVSNEPQPINYQNTRSQASGSLLPDVLPVIIGQCAQTTVTKVENRLQSGENGVFIAGSGSAIEYSNKGYQVSYEQVAGVDRSHIGDKVQFCLVAIPKDCPSGDERGKIYSAKNLRTNESWTLPDAEHMCGGA